MTRRVAFGLAGLAALLLLGAALTPPPFRNADAVMVEAMRARSGLDIALNGHAEVVLLPSPHVRLVGVSFSRHGEPPFLVAREVTGSPRLVPLLMGRFELNRITLDGAEIALDRAPVGALFDAGEAEDRPAPSLPEIRLTDSRLSWGSRSVDKVEGGVAWASRAGPIALSGYGQFGGRLVEASFALTDPDALARGGPSPFRARIEGGGANVVFDGSAVSTEQGPRFAGDLSARASSLRETLRWLGAPAPRRSSPLSGFSLAGSAIADREGLSISNAEFNLEGDSFLGVGRFTAIDGRPNIEATLDTDRLDLDPYINGIAPTLRETGGWSPRPVELKSIAGYQLDLRLSAGEVRFGAVKLGPTAATVSIAQGGLDLAVGEASAYGGTIGGHLSVVPEDAGARVRLQAALTDVDLDRALGRFVDQPALTGALTGDLAVEGLGASAADVIATLDGRATMAVAGGSLDGVTRSKTLALAGISRSMKISSAQAKLTVTGGVARTDDLMITGTDAVFTLSGEARLVERDLKMQGFVKPTTGGWTLPITVEGALAAPKLKPNLAYTREPHAEAERTPSHAPGGS